MNSDSLLAAAIMAARALPGVVLVIEDDPIQLSHAQSTVKQLGHTVLTAVSGEEALSIVRTRKVDVVLMDVFLPDMHGSELCPRLLDAAEGEGPSVIAVSVSNDAENISKCLRSGAVDYVVKPLVRIATCSPNAHDVPGRERSRSD